MTAETLDDLQCWKPQEAADFLGVKLPMDMVLDCSIRTIQITKLSMSSAPQEAQQKGSERIN